jgi:hypothetical protein
MGSHKDTSLILTYKAFSHKRLGMKNVRMQHSQKTLTYNSYYFTPYALYNGQYLPWIECIGDAAEEKSEQGSLQATP